MAPLHRGGVLAKVGAEVLSGVVGSSRRRRALGRGAAAERLERVAVLGAALVVVEVVAPACEVALHAQAGAEALHEGLEVGDRGGDEGPAELDLLPGQGRDDGEAGVGGVDVVADVVEMDDGEGGETGKE